MLELSIPAATNIVLDIIAVSVLMAEILGLLLLKRALVRAGEIKELIKQETPIV